MKKITALLLFVYSATAALAQLTQPGGNQNNPARKVIGVRFDSTTATVEFIAKGSPGEAAGLLIGDKVIAVGGTNVNGKTIIPAILAQGETFAMDIIRKGKPKSFTLIKQPLNSFTEKCLTGDCNNGAGTYVFADYSHYTGQFINGKPEGKGKANYPTGSSYEGSWKDGKWHGDGKLTNQQGEVFTGSFDKEAIVNGTGTFELKNGNKIKGTIKDRKLNGQGELIYADKRKYVGNFVDDKRSGKGTFTWPNGESYTGDFANNMREGEGTQFYTNGDKYTGAWKKDKKDGKGIWYKKLPNGSFEQAPGNWVDGNLVNNPVSGAAYTIQQFDLPAGLTWGMSVQKAMDFLKQKGNKEIEELMGDINTTKFQYFEVKHFQYMGYKGTLKVNFTYNTLTGLQYRQYEKFDLKKINEELQKKYGNAQESEPLNDENRFAYTYWQDKIKIKYSGESNAGGDDFQFYMEYFYPELSVNTVYKKDAAPYDGKFPLGLNHGMFITDAISIILKNGGITDKEDMPDPKGVLLNSEADFYFNNVLYNSIRHRINLQFTYGRLTEISFTSQEKEKFDEAKIQNQLQSVWGTPESSKTDDLSNRKTVIWNNKDKLDVSFEVQRNKQSPEEEYYKLFFFNNSLRSVMRDLDERMTDPRKIENINPLEGLGIK